MATLYFTRDTPAIGRSVTISLYAPIRITLVSLASTVQWTGLNWIAGGFRPFCAVLQTVRRLANEGNYLWLLSNLSLNFPPPMKLRN